MWLVMIVQQWDSITGHVGAIPFKMTAPNSGSAGFVEVYEGREAALAAADGNAALVLQVKEVQRD